MTARTNYQQSSLTKDQLYEIKEELINICQQSSKKILLYYHPRFICNSDTTQNSPIQTFKYHTKMNNIADIVTELDKCIERDIRTYLMEKFPKFGFLGEESGYTRPIEKSSE